MSANNQFLNLSFEAKKRWHTVSFVLLKVIWHNFAPGFGYSFQNARLFWHISVEQIKFHGAYGKMARKKQLEIAITTLKGK